MSKPDLKPVEERDCPHPHPGRNQEQSSRPTGWAGNNGPRHVSNKSWKKSVAS